MNGSNKIIPFHSSRSQIRQTLKKKAFEDAGIPVKQMALVQAPVQQQPQPQIIQVQLQPQPQIVQVTQDQIQEVTVCETVSQTGEIIKSETEQNQLGMIGTSADMMMTLNRLNTQESEVDVESLSTSEVKLEFDTEEVAGWNELTDLFL